MFETTDVSNEGGLELGTFSVNPDGLVKEESVRDLRVPPPTSKDLRAAAEIETKVDQDADKRDSFVIRGHSLSVNQSSRRSIIDTSSVSAAREVAADCTECKVATAVAECVHKWNPDLTIWLATGPQCLVYENGERRPVTKQEMISLITRTEGDVARLLLCTEGASNPIHAATDVEVKVIPPSIITIAGEAGVQANLMGTYKLLLSRQYNGYPLYYMKSDDISGVGSEAEGGIAYLYR